MRHRCDVKVLEIALICVMIVGAVTTRGFAATARVDTLVSLQSSHGRYLVAESNHGVKADRTAVGAWEKWTLLDNRDGTVSFRSAHGRYLVAEPNHGVKADRTALGSWERWKRIDNGDGTVSFRSAHGRYLVAESNHGVKADRTAIGAWEKWTLRQITDGSGSAGYDGADPAGLELGNLLSNPGFNGSPCHNGWAIETVEVACNAGAGFAWLNHNNRAGDPAVTQTITGLEAGKEYEIVVGWRGGDHGPIHGVSGARNIFAIDIDGREIRRLTTSSSYTDWMVNDRPESDSHHATVTFTATAPSHTLRFRGEVGADGDVLLAWASVRESFQPQLFPFGSEGRRRASEVDAGKEITVEVLFVDFSDQPAPATGTNFAGLWSTISSSGEAVSAMTRHGATVTVNLHEQWARMPAKLSEYHFPTGSGWDWERYIDDATKLLPAASYPANTIAVAVPNRGLTGWNADVPSGQHGVAGKGKGVRSLITLSPKIYDEHYTTLLHEIGHSFGSFELYPGSAPYTHKVGGYDLMGDVVFATGFLGWHRYRYGWLDGGSVDFLSHKGDYRVDLKKLSLNRGTSMVVLPDRQKALKYWVIEIGQDVQSRDQYKAGQNQKLNTEGERLIVYTVEEPRPRERILLEPRVGFEGNHGTTDWLDKVSYKAGQGFSKAGAPFSFTDVKKTSEGFSLLLTVPEDIDFLTYGEDATSPDGSYQLQAQGDGNVVVRNARGDYVWDFKTKLFDTSAANQHVALRRGKLQAVEITSMAVRSEKSASGLPAGGRFAVGNDGIARVIDYRSRVWWQRP